MTYNVTFSTFHGVCRLEAIQKTGEIRKMARTHIHFASEAHHMRTNAWANVLLKLDLERALKQGYKFFRSSNGVVLAEGPIPVKFLVPVTKDDVLSKKRCMPGGDGDRHLKSKCVGEVEIPS